MAFKDQAELEAFKTWAQGQINAMGRHAHTSGLVGKDVTGRMVWAVPHKVFLGKVWPAQDRRSTYWVISGEALPTDHITEGLAATPRDAARHFALKWQLESSHLGSMAAPERQLEQREEAERDVDWKQIASTLERQAELLYKIIERDDLWETNPVFEETDGKV